MQTYKQFNTKKEQKDTSCHIRNYRKINQKRPRHGAVSIIRQFKKEREIEKKEKPTVEAHIPQEA